MSRLGPACKCGKPRSQLWEGFNSFISPCTISICYQGNTQPAEFFAFCIIGPVLSAFTGKGSWSWRHSRFHKGMCVERRGYRDIKGSCFACCPVSQQKVSRMGVAMIGCGVIASFHLDAKMRWHVSARTSRSVLCRTTTSPPCLQVVAWCPRGSRALPGQSAHWDPWEVSIPSHHFMATSWTSASRCRPSPCDGRTDSQNDACGAETESNRAWSALEEVSNSRLNMQVSNVLDSSFWETRDAERREWICSALSGGTAELKSATAEQRWRFVSEPNPAEQIHAAGASWYSERRPNLPFLRPRIACLQAVSEVSTEVQELKKNNMKYMH